MQKWNRNWREKTWESLPQNWDIIIIGGGVTGAGVFTEGVRLGLKCLLIEENDFASGASGASSKLVHGGLRYLKNGQIHTTFESIRERERLLKHRKGLVKRLGFLHLHLKTDKLPGWLFGIGLSLYDIIGGTWLHRHYDKYDMQGLCPLLGDKYLIDGYRFFDALTDDARLVFRLIREGVSHGGTALNYTKAKSILKLQNGTVCGVIVSNSSNKCKELNAKYVVNATGAKTEIIRKYVNKKHSIRPLRGSHLVIPKSKLPVSRAVSFAHPADQRPVFAIPWKGVTMFGTTDVDHQDVVNNPPSINQIEVDYLLEGLNHVFGHHHFTDDDILSTFSGIRPTINTGQKNPSKESREFEVNNENRLISVSGGKLTTFRVMAKRVLKLVKLTKNISENSFQLPENKFNSKNSSIDFKRLVGRFADDVEELLEQYDNTDFEQIEGTPYSLAEIKWIAQNEAVEHLDDIFLRRTRLGLLLPNGAEKLLHQIKSTLCSNLQWDETNWKKEVCRYMNIYKSQFSLPGAK